MARGAWQALSVQLCRWMSILLLFGRTFLTNRNCTFAKAFSSQSILTASRSWSVRGGRLIDQRSGICTLLTEQSNGNNGDGSFEAVDPEERIPATGWNHNTPSNPNFWKPVNGDQSQNFPKKAQGEEAPTKAARTGWLHNTAPSAKPKPVNQESSGSGGTTGSTGNGISKAQDRLKQAMLQQERNHRIVSPPAFHACGNGRQIVVTDHRLSVPLLTVDTKTRSPRIDLAFTIVEEVTDEAALKWFQSLTSQPPQQRAQAYIEKAALANADDMLIYLQGGPGFGAPTPVVGLSFAGESSWGAKALSKFKRIVLMDQRGTGRSSPITKQTLEKRFPDLFLLDDKGAMSLEDLSANFPEEYPKFQAALQEATNYMAQFRADKIVQDAEYLREALLLPKEPGSDPPGPRPWGGVLGQSYGGFCIMSYLSLVDHPPRICLLTGGIAPMLTSAYDTYAKLWDRVKERSWLYYEMYPGDIPLVKRIVRTLLDRPQKLPSGGTLTARRFLQYGMALGGSPSSFASMHQLLSSAFLEGDSSSEFSRTFVKYFDSAQPFDDNPIYYWLHESIYADGPSNSPTQWAAHRAYLDKPANEFDYHVTCRDDNDSTPTLFFGEMVFPWMAEDYAECSGLGCTSLVNALANKEDWPPLYDKDHMRKVLDTAGVTRAAAAVYYGDLYVDFDFSMKVASRGGPLEKCKVYVTNEYQHSGLRDDGATIFSKLYGMATGSVRTPS